MTAKRLVVGGETYLLVSRFDVARPWDLEDAERRIRALLQMPSGRAKLRQIVARKEAGAIMLSDREIVQIAARLLHTGRLRLVRIARPVLPLDELPSRPLADPTWGHDDPDRPPSSDNDSITVVLKDDSGRAVPHEPYVLRFPDGQTLEGRLDADGRAHHRGIPTGTCRISFPRIDAGDWRRHGPSSGQGQEE